VRKLETPSAAAGCGSPLDPLIHGRVRLLVLAQLARHGAASFTDLRKRLALTDGTLSVHLSKLQEGGIVEITKEFVGKRPNTLVRLTRSGRTAFTRYVAELREIVPGLE
jgi:DNA-binding transcriptional ArsR family regulator